MLAKGVRWAVGSRERMHRPRPSQMRWCVSCFLQDAWSRPRGGDSVRGALLQAEGLCQRPGSGLRLLGGAGGAQVCKGLVATQTLRFQPEGKRQPSRGDAGNLIPLCSLSPPHSLTPQNLHK